MFDMIVIGSDITLPMPDQLCNQDPSKMEFQTKSLDCTMSTYLVKKDGLYLYEEEGELSNVNFHGILDFGIYHTTDLVDYSVDFRAKYTDGLFVSLEQKCFKEFRHESKKEALMQRMKSRGGFLLYLQKTFVSFLNVFGCSLRSEVLGCISNKRFLLRLSCPDLLLFRKSQYFSEYGPFITNLDTGLRFSILNRFLCFKLLGFGLFVSFFSSSDSIDYIK